MAARKRPENHELFSPQQGYSIFLIVYIVYIYIFCEGYSLQHSS